MEKEGRKRGKGDAMKDGEEETTKKDKIRKKKERRGNQEWSKTG